MDDLELAANGIGFFIAAMLILDIIKLIEKARK